MALETEQIASEDLPIYDKPTIDPSGQVILLVDEPNYDLGGTLSAAYRLPISRVIPNNTLQGLTYSLSAPDAGISIPDQTVVPAYIEPFGSNALKRALASSQTTKAKFLILSTNQNVDGSYIIQGSGYYSFPTVHGYDVGLTYYLSDSAAGGVTSTPPSSITQPLFYVVDQKTIQILIGA